MKSKIKTKNRGFTRHYFHIHMGNQIQKQTLSASAINSPLSVKNRGGFTLIELLVVIAIIALLSSIALIGYQDARQKSRDAKRLSDMTQMANAFELFFSYNKGYPLDTTVMQQKGILMTVPQAPQPPDGNCATLLDMNNQPVTAYSYYPSGTAYTLNGLQLYPDYYLSFCLGEVTGNFSPGVHYVTPKGIR